VQQKIFGIVDENNLKNRPEYDRYFYKKPWAFLYPWQQSQKD
jgi:hypothetical protein